MFVPRGVRHSEGDIAKLPSVAATMTVTVKNKTPLMVPDQVRRRAGLRHGDKVEFKVSGGVINIVPKLPSADDEYTPAERRLIDARLREASKGPYYGPFGTAHEAVAFLRAEIRKRKAIKRKTS
jgi:bifunctional DNA-binding transcriptional regulator/antitoxin component of YhaV-PrlF toxin-antitoxin module